MPQFSIPNTRSHRMETFLSPRKSLIAVGVVCVVSAAALWVGRTPSPPDAQEASLTVTVPGSPMNAPHRK